MMGFDFQLVQPQAFIKSIIRTRLFNDYLGSLTNTPVIQRLPQLFNDYNGMEARKPSKTHKTPLQNCSAAGFTYALKQPKSLISSGFRA